MYTDDPGTAATSFTQGEINKGKISYKPAEGEIGLVPHTITVVFDVEDTNGNSEQGNFLLHLLSLWR